MVVQKRVANRDMAFSKTTYTRRGGSSSISGRRLRQVGDAAAKEASAAGAVLEGKEERSVDADDGHRDGGGDRDAGVSHDDHGGRGVRLGAAFVDGDEGLGEDFGDREVVVGRRGAMPSKLAVPGGRSKARRRPSFCKAAVKSIVPPSRLNFGRESVTLRRPVSVRFARRAKWSGVWRAAEASVVCPALGRTITPCSPRPR